MANLLIQVWSCTMSTAMWITYGYLAYKLGLGLIALERYRIDRSDE